MRHPPGPRGSLEPGGRRIDLRVAVVPALAADPRPDPLFAIAGGPGEAGTQFFAWLPGLFTGVHATRDIVLIDQRGTGGSNPLTLPPAPDTSGMSAAQAEARLAAWMHDALAALDADPRFYTSTVAADDLDDVRAALGYDTIDLYGTSYGGTLAQYYLRQHPDHVRVAVLDGSTPLDVPVLERMAANSQHALDLLLARCAADAACHRAFPDIEDEWTSLAGRLADGVTTTVVNPETGEHAVADLLTVGPSVHNALLTGSGGTTLPLAIHLASEGDWTRSGELVPPVFPAHRHAADGRRDHVLRGVGAVRPRRGRSGRRGELRPPGRAREGRIDGDALPPLPAGRGPGGRRVGGAHDGPRPVDHRRRRPAGPAGQPHRGAGAAAQRQGRRDAGAGARRRPPRVRAGRDRGLRRSRHGEGLDTSCIAQGAAPAPAFLLP